MHFQVVFVAHKKTYYLIGGPPNNNFKEFKNGKLLINEECQLRSDRNFFAAVSHAQKLFLFGGYEASSRKQLRTCESFDLEKQSWHPLASMRKERSMAAACKINED
jgi:N-acetylneuraminic acid mutarotase